MAARYFINGGVDSNWSTSGNWSATDGGAASGVKPTASDDVFFTSNSPNCTVNTAGVGLTLNFTGYASTITMTAGLTISGSVTLVSAMTIAGTGGLIVSATSTLTSNTKVWPNALTLQGTSTHTLADNWNVDGLLSVGGGTITINGFQITASAGLTQAGNNTSGTTNIIMDGTGTITHSTSAGALRNNLTINTAGTITFATTFAFLYDTGTFTYTAGTVVTTGSTLTVGVTTTLAVAGITWNNVNLTTANGQTITLNENLNLTGLLTLASSTNSITLTGSTINAGGGVRYGGSSGTVSGTTVINVNGTGTLDGPSATSGRIDNPITINAPSGTVTIATAGDTPFRMLLNQLNCVAGTIVTDTGTWTAFGGGEESSSVFG